MQVITGQLVDIFNKKIFPAVVSIENGRILRIDPLSAADQVVGEVKTAANFIMPGFIDAHVHIESSMLIPSEFARLAVVHGTVATVSDPHEIANVCGVKGVEFMIENGNKVPFKFNFGAPSCVPATSFETAGATVNVEDVKALLQRDEIKYLSEMMNFPGVLFNDKEVMKKIESAHLLGKPVDGHAPGLRGEEAKKYIDAGITTDHECFTKEEAIDKLRNGMKVIIREGSAAKNFEALIDLLNEFPADMMFCSDDKHPDSLVEGHINKLCLRALAKNIDLFNILQAACVNPVLHYKLDVGLLREGDAADFIIVEDLQNFTVLQTYINGELVAENGKSLITQVDSTAINNFNCSLKNVGEFKLQPSQYIFEGTYALIIEAIDGQLISNKAYKKLPVTEHEVLTDMRQDILKLVVVNRYGDAPVSKAFIKGFGMKSGAIASSVAHDSHNIVAVGVDDEMICRAVNLIIEARGGVSCVNNEGELVLGLPVAGLMATTDGYSVAKAYTAIDAMAKSLGSSLAAPFMTLSFMALLVIPHLKLSDKGLFDGDEFKLMVSH